jgi:hypothetical protein
MSGSRDSEGCFYTVIIRSLTSWSSTEGVGCDSDCNCDFTWRNYRQVDLFQAITCVLYVEQRLHYESVGATKNTS